MNQIILKISVFHEADYGVLFSDLAQLGLHPEPVNTEDRLCFSSKASMNKLIKITRILKKYSEIVRKAELIMAMSDTSGAILRIAFIQLNHDDFEEDEQDWLG